MKKIKKAELSYKNAAGNLHTHLTEISWKGRFTRKGKQFYK